MSEILSIRWLLYQLLQENSKLKKELDELKQELRQILDDFGDIQDYDNDDVIELHGALTKLLNEEKETQP